MPGPIATVGSMHVCPMCTGTIPHIGGPISLGEPNILVNGKPIATMGSLCTCVGFPDTVAQGSPFIFANGKPVACLGDLTAHGGTITVGEPNVLISSAVPTASVNMPLNKIPFPEIKFIDKLVSSNKIKEAQENQEKLKKEEKGNPRIYNVRWIKGERIIRESKVLKEVKVNADVSNIDDGQEITFKIKRPIKITDKEGNVKEGREELVELKGTVKDRKVEIIWEVKEVSNEKDSS